MPDSATQNVMNAYMQSLLHGGNFEEFFAPDVVWTFMENGDQVRGREGVRDLIAGMHTQTFDAHPELRGLLIGDGTAVAEAVFVGTHTGEFAGIPATGVHVRLPYCMAYDVAGGVITALRAYFPLAALGALLTEASRSAGALS